MQKAGMKLDRHYKEVAFMGFVEVILHLRKIKKEMDRCYDRIRSGNYDAVILIDYPGFNLRLAERIRPHTNKIIYYISPQIWAWKENRVKKIRSLVDEMITILPFEKSFYARHDMDVHFAGHPLLDHIEEDSFHEKSLQPVRIKKIGLLPGSRRQEIKRMLPVMLEFARKQSEFTYTIVRHPSIPESVYLKIIGKQANVKIGNEGTSKVLKESDFALVTSGTATLETALYRVPQLILYKANPISYLIAKRLVKVKYISLVNLIMDNAVVRELIQKECNVHSINAEFKKLLVPRNREQLLANYEAISEKLGGKGASMKAAEIIRDSLS